MLYKERESISIFLFFIKKEKYNNNNIYNKKKVYI